MQSVFDVMYVRVPKEGVRKRLHAYGLALNKQNNVLEQMTERVSSMRVIGKNGLFPFQKGIFQSNNALKFLLDDLRQQYKIDYVLTYRLNQDVLEFFFFCVIRSKGSLHDHPDRQEFKYRLRSYILGHNEGAITYERNVEVDNTPDLEGNYLSLTGNIFQCVSVDLNTTDPIEKNDGLEILNNNGLENLAGYICHKLVKDNSEICANSEKCSSHTWVDHLSEGGLKKSTDMLMEHMRALQVVFDDVNGTDLHICMYKLRPEGHRFK